SLLAKLVVRADAGGFGAVAAKARSRLSDFIVSGVPTNIGLLRTLLALAERLDGQGPTALVEQQLADMALTHPMSAETATPGNATGAVIVAAPMIGTIFEINVEVGATVAAGQEIAVIEAMKMQHPVLAPVAGVVTALEARAGETVTDGQTLVSIDPCSVQHDAVARAEREADLDAVRPDLLRVQGRRRAASDEGRAEAVAKRRRTGQRTAR